MRPTAMMIALLFCLITAGQSGCRTPGVLGSRGDSLSGRLNSPLNGDLHFAGADNGMNAPEPADFQEATGEKSDSSWSGLWARLKPSRTLTLPRTDFRSGQESISEAQASTALEAGF